MKLAHDVLSRRGLLGSGLAFAAWSAAPSLARAAGGRDPRLVVMVLRGALDGLAAVAPLGDPDYLGRHGELSLRLDGPRPALPLDAMFALNPSMPAFERQYREGHGLVVHAVATGYRERSHFDGQDVLESGQPRPGLVASGWLNRAVGLLPRVAGRSDRLGLAVGSTTPLVLRGPTPVLGWAPQVMAPAGDDLARRVLDLYRRTDRPLAEALTMGLDTERMAMAVALSPDMAKARGGMDQPAGMRRAAAGAAKLLALDEGPRVAALALDGWDTHAGEGVVEGTLARRLSGLDGAFEELEKGLGSAWADTTVVAVTEFGRTVRVNGTDGTDHGTATVAFLTGGAVRGGRIVADWPGLSDAALHEGRDLKPTTDLRGVFAGVLAEGFGLDARQIAEIVFPGTVGLRPISGLLV